MNSSFDETALKFFSEVEDIFLKALGFLHLATLDVVVDALLLDLVSRQAAQVVFGLGNSGEVIFLINLMSY